MNLEKRIKRNFSKEIIKFAECQTKRNLNPVL